MLRDIIMLKEKNIIIAVIVGALIIGFFIYITFAKNPFEIESSYPAANDQDKAVALESLPCGANSNTMVTKVIDGDTVVVEGGYHVRLLGIDADEKNYPCYDAARVRLEQLLLGKTVVLEKDKTDIDRYGRCLRTLFYGDKNISVALVKEGLAVARFYPPDVKYKSEISLAEKQAIENNTGCKWQQ